MALCVATLGELLRELRETIGFSRDELSWAAGVSSSLIYKTETDPDYKSKRSTSIKLIRALQAGAAQRGVMVPGERWAEFLSAAGLPAGAGSTTQREALDQLGREASVREREPADERRCRDLLADLIARRGAAAVLKLLESAMAFAASGDEDAADDRPRSLRVKHAPIQRDGYVEQTVVEYEDHSGESKAQKSDAKPRARRAR